MLKGVVAKLLSYCTLCISISFINNLSDKRVWLKRLILSKSRNKQLNQINLKWKLISVFFGVYWDFFTSSYLFVSMFLSTCMNKWCSMDVTFMKFFDNKVQHSRWWENLKHVFAWLWSSLSSSFPSTRTNPQKAQNSPRETRSPTPQQSWERFSSSSRNPTSKLLQWIDTRLKLKRNWYRNDTKKYWVCQRNSDSKLMQVWYQSILSTSE